MPRDRGNRVCGLCAVGKYGEFPIMYWTDIHYALTDLERILGEESEESHWYVYKEQHPYLLIVPKLLAKTRPEDIHSTEYLNWKASCAPYMQSMHKVRIDFLFCTDACPPEELTNFVLRLFQEGYPVNHGIICGM